MIGMHREEEEEEEEEEALGDREASSKGSP
jgi:hypothetical protein